MRVVFLPGLLQLVYLGVIAAVRLRHVKAVVRVDSGESALVLSRAVGRQHDLENQFREAASSFIQVAAINRTLGVIIGTTAFPSASANASATLRVAVAINTSGAADASEVIHRATTTNSTLGVAAGTDAILGGLANATAAFEKARAVSAASAGAKATLGAANTASVAAPTTSTAAAGLLTSREHPRPRTARLAQTSAPRRGRIAIIAILTVVVVSVLALLMAFALLMWLVGYVLRRQAYFWWHVGPIVLVYRWSLKKPGSGGSLEEAEEQRVLNALHEEYAPKALEIVQSLGGMFLKIAQAFSNNPMVPMAYRREFSKCCDQNRPMDFVHVRKQIEAALRGDRPARMASKKLEDAFCWFDEDPFGVASIGQVHRGQVTKTGQEVAVKVKFPAVEEIFKADFASLRVFARVLGAQWAVALVDEFSKQIAQEFDYKQEALNIEAMHRVLMPRFEGRIEIPGVCYDLTTDNVLTMTFVEGTRLDLALKQRLQAAGVDAAHLEKMALAEGNGGGIPGNAGGGQRAHPQASRWRPLTRLSERTTGLMLDVLLAALRVRSSISRCFHGVRSSLGGQPSQYQSAAGEILARADVRAVLTTLLDVWGYSMLQVGTFHADPHPGNVLLQPSGRLGLLDYGQVTTIPVKTRRGLAELLLALVADNDITIIETVRRLGFEMEAAVPDESNSGNASLAEAGSVQPVEAPEVEFAKIVFGGALPDQQQRTRVVRSIRKAPSEMFFVIRCAVLLRGVGLGLGQRVSLAESWKKWASAFLAMDAKRGTKEPTEEQECD